MKSSCPALLVEVSLQCNKQIRITDRMLKKAAGLPLESDEFRSVDGPSPFRSVSD